MSLESAEKMTVEEVYGRPRCKQCLARPVELQLDKHSESKPYYMKNKKGEDMLSDLLVISKSSVPHDSGLCYYCRKLSSQSQVDPQFNVDLRKQLELKWKRTTNAKMDEAK